MGSFLKNYSDFRDLQVAIEIKRSFCFRPKIVVATNIAPGGRVWMKENRIYIRVEFSNPLV